MHNRPSTMCFKQWNGFQKSANPFVLLIGEVNQLITAQLKINQKGQQLSMLLLLFILFMIIPERDSLPTNFTSGFFCQPDSYSPIKGNFGAILNSVEISRRYLISKLIFNSNISTKFLPYSKSSQDISNVTRRCLMKKSQLKKSCATVPLRGNLSNMMYLQLYPFCFCWTALLDISASSRLRISSGTGGPKFVADLSQQSSFFTSAIRDC